MFTLSTLIYNLYTGWPDDQKLKGCRNALAFPIDEQSKGMIATELSKRRADR
jgi:hypothetical protein